ncbi:MAG: hypothetical protein M3365_06215 [Gemmatimonadota bacterium]|nr:hypothetical protein [Gemmatimonadota bacterium]
MKRAVEEGASPSPASDRREGRRFALTLAAGFLLVAAIGYWRGAYPVAEIAAAIAAISFLAAALIPGRLEPARKAWIELGELLGSVTTPILLAIVYYGLVTPIGLIRRLVGGAHRPGAESGWYQRPPLPPRERMERQF